MLEVSAPPRPGRPKSEAKAKAVMYAAAKLFLARGFQGTSMDAVAKGAGVSKQTVYSHYENKEELFKAVITTKVASYGFDEATVVKDDDLRNALLTVARRFVDLLFDPEVIAMHRVVIGEATSQPRIASLFFESGPMRTKAAVCAFLQRQVAKGRLCIPAEQVLYAASQLLFTAIGVYQMQLMLGLIESVDETELGPHLERVVDDFLTLYRA
ncbi:MAG: TetR/AcrR family transcriptional regulator [Chromatiales bacterium]